MVGKCDVYKGTLSGKFEEDNFLLVDSFFLSFGFDVPRSGSYVPKGTLLKGTRTVYESYVIIAHCCV